MCSISRRLGLALLLAGLGLLPVSTADAQFNYVPQRYAAQATQRAAAVGAAVGARTGYVQGLAQAPYYSPGYYPPSYGNYYVPWYDASGGYLHGAADLINSQGQLMNQYQQSLLMHEDVKRSKIDTRRKAYDEWLYERANRPTLEDERERYQYEQWRQSRNNPPSAEIWSGKALNDLLVHVLQTQGTSSYGPVVPLDPEVMAHINLTSGATGASVGVFKHGSKLAWPFALQTAEFADERRQIDDLAGQAVQQAAEGSPDANTLRTLRDAIAAMQGHVKQDIERMMPSDNVKAKRFLNELDEGVRGLTDANAANYFNGTWKARGDTVGQLVGEMTRQGLKFAPATAGDEAAYTALHRALVAYDTQLTQLTARVPPSFNSPGMNP